MRSFAIVARAKAGRGKSRRMANAIHALLKEHGAQSRLYLTSGERGLDSLVKLARHEHTFAAGGSLCIVFCGGDGSIQEGINALCTEPAADVLVGLGPAGTCNDFAFALGVKSSPKDVVNVLLYGAVRPVDLGMAGNKYFCTVATLGLESTVNRCLRNYVTRSPPRWLLVAAASATLVTHAPLQARVTIDGNTMDVEILNLLAANTSFYGGHIRIAPSANPGDGHIDIVMFHAMSKLRRLLMLPHAVAGRHLQRPGVTCRRAARVTIETDLPTEVWADGEPIGKTPIDLKVVRKALRMLVPE